jgi:hypothetical protein
MAKRTCEQSGYAFRQLHGLIFKAFPDTAAAPVNNGPDADLGQQAPHMALRLVLCKR